MTTYPESDLSPLFPLSTPPARPGLYAMYDSEGRDTRHYYAYNGHCWCGCWRSWEEAKEYFLLWQEDWPLDLELEDREGWHWRGLTKEAHDKIRATLGAKEKGEAKK